MIVVDLETTGLDSRTCSILSIGALDFDNPKNQFYEECRIWEGAHVQDEALEVNGFTFESIVNSTKKTDKEILESFIEWSKEVKYRTLAGENPSFDRDFLKYTAYRYHINWTFAERTVDLHSVSYAHHLQNEKELPRKNTHSALNLAATLKYVGISDYSVPHHALEDTKLAAEAFFRLLYNKGLFEEFSQFKIPWL
jgi:DNA polymerase III epsilon subunit-like protein